MKSFHFLIEYFLKFDFCYFIHFLTYFIYFINDFIIYDNESNIYKKDYLIIINIKDF